MTTKWLVAVAVSLALAPAGAMAQGSTGPIRIGGIVFLTGKYSSYGKTVADGLKLAEKQVNANGGVLGRKVQIDIEDNASESQQAVNLLRRLNASSDVVGIAGPTGTPDLLASLPVAPQLTTPVVSIASVAPLPASDFPDNVFRVAMVQNAAMVRDVLAAVGDKKGTKRVALLMDQTNDAQQAEGKQVREAAKGAGMTLVADEAYSSGDKDFSVLIDKAVRGGADLLWIAGNTNEVVLIMRQARARGFKGPFIGGTAMTDPRIFEIAKDAAVGTITFSAFSPQSDRPVVKAFVEAYRRDVGPGSIATLTAYGYDAGLLMADAIARAGSTDRAKVREALGATKNFQGVTGSYSFNGKGDNTSTQPYILEIGADGQLGMMK